MKKSFLLMLLASVVFLTVGSLNAQDVSNEAFPSKGEIYVYPESPSVKDSVYMTYKYISNDGCPDYYLVKDSVAPGIIKIKLKEIPAMGRVCTMVISTFKTSLNLGLITEPTNVYLDGKLVKTVKPKAVVPECVPDLTGKIINSTEGNNIIQEDKTGRLYQILDKIYLKPGTVIKFNGTEIQCIKAPCFNIVNCYKIVSVPGECVMNLKGVIVIGKGECSNQLFIQEYSPISSAIQLWKIASITADAVLKPGDEVMFGGTKITPDPKQDFYCRVVGYANCVKRISVTPPPPPPVNQFVELKGIAMADSVLLSAGYAVMYSKGYKKAVASSKVVDGEFRFKGLKDASYTVLVVPDRRVISGYLPTFYVDKLNFRTADFVTLTDSVQKIQIILRKYAKKEGDGKITGKLNYENQNQKDTVFVKDGVYNERKGVTDESASNIPVLLLDSKRVPTNWTITDEAGNYEFVNVKAENYSVVAETTEAVAEIKVELGNSLMKSDANMMLKTIAESTDVERVSEDIQSVYPNPVKDICTFNVKQAGKLAIISLNGQVMHVVELQAGTNMLNLSVLPKGLFVAKFGQDAVKLRKE
jgi:hypothetical protein